MELKPLATYLREHEPWSVHLAEHGRGDRPPTWLATWRGDGILARIETPAMARALRRLKVPIVDVSAARLIPALPWFETDDSAIAQMAFDHLRDRGYRRFAYCGDARFNWSNWRGEHFQRAVAAEGSECLFYQPTRRFRPDDAAQGDDLARWLRKLPKPVGIMACYDPHGRQLLDACRRVGIAVPDEVAVISVDNDEVLCELSHPPLTSVIPNTHRTGYEAASLLDELMAGRKLRAETRLVPPIGVAARQSTSTLAIEDRKTALAVRFIREQACSGINVADVLKAVPHSRRLMESRFRRLLGRTPHEEILRVQMDRVKQLLVETDLPLAEVAERAGFAHVEYLSVVFKRETGIPPSAFRRANR